MKKLIITEQQLKLINEQLDDERNSRSINESDLETLKKINYLVSKPEVLDWFNSNDVESGGDFDYGHMTDIEMYIKYIEAHLKNN